MLDVNKSRFVDFQKVRIQETQAELPRGSIPRSVEVELDELGDVVLLALIDFVSINKQES